MTRSRILRLARRVVLIAAVLTVVLVLAAFLLLHTSWARGQARDLIIRQAQLVLNGNLTIGKLEGDFFSGVDLYDVALAHGGVVAVRAGRLRVQYSAWQLLRGDAIVVRQLDIADLTLTGRRDQTGRLNLADLVKKRTSPSGQTGPRRPIHITEIRVERGAVSFDGPWGPTWARLPTDLSNIAAVFGLNYQLGELSLPVRSLQATGANPSFDVNSFAGTLRFAGSSWSIADGKLRSHNTVVDFTVAVLVNDKSRSYDIVANAPLFDFPVMAPVLPGVRSIRVPAQAAVRMRGPEQWVETDINLKSSAGHIDANLYLDTTVPGWRGQGSAKLANLDTSQWLPTEAVSNITGESDFDLLLGLGRHFPRGAFKFAGPRVVYVGYEASQVAAAGRLTETRAVIDRGTGIAYGAPVRLSGWIGLPQPYAFDLSGVARSMDLRRLPPSVPLPKVTSALSFKFRARGHFTEPVLVGDAVFEESTFLGARIGAGSEGAVDTTTIPVRYTARGQVGDLDLPTVGEAFDVPLLQQPRYAGRVSGAFDVTGEGFTLGDVSLQLKGRSAEAGLFGGRLSETALDLVVVRDTLSGSAVGRFERINARTLTQDSRYEGELAGRFDLTGSLPRLFTAGVLADVASVHGRVSVEGSRISGIGIESASLEGLSLADGLLRFERLKTRTDMGELSANGALAIAGGESDFAYDVDISDLSKLKELISLPIAGAVVIKGRALGPVGTIRAEGTFSGTDLAGPSVSALSALGKFTADVPIGRMSDLAASTNVTATLVNVLGRQVGTATATISYAKQRLEGELEARLPDARVARLSGSLVIHADHNELHARELQFDFGNRGWRMSDNAPEAIASWNADVITVRNLVLLSGPPGSGRLSITGSLGRYAPAGTVSVDLRNIALEELTPLAPWLSEYRGHLSGTALIMGSVQAPEVHVGFTVGGGGFRQFTFDSLTVLGRWTGEELEGDVRLEQRPGTWLSAHGMIPADMFSGSGSTRPVNLSIRSSPIALGILQGLTSSVEDLEGTLEVNVTARGPSADPHFDGFVDVAGAAFRVPSTGAAYRNGVARLALAADSVTVERGRIEDDKGDPLELTGTASTHELRLGQVGLELSATRFEILQNELGDVDVNGVMTLTGTLAAPVITGDLGVHRATLRGDRLLALTQRPYGIDPPSVQTSGPASPWTMPSLGSLWNALTLRLRLQATNNLTVRGDDLRFTRGPSVGLGDVDVTLGGDVSIRKSPGAAVTASGELHTVRGTYAFQGRRFTVDRDGTIRFTGESVATPEVSVSATRTVSGVVIRVAVLGPVTAPQLQLSSSPGLEESDILSLLIFNQPANELAGAQRAELAIQAASLAGGFVVNPAVSAIGQSFGLDFLDIQPSAEGSEGTLRLSAGRQIGRGLFVTYGREFGANEYNEFLIEYELSRYLRLRANASDASGARARASLLFRRVERAGIDLLFFFSY